MATQNSTITVKGKLGNIVGYKGRDGKRLARIRQTEVKNPKTDGQIIQRMILATGSKAYGLMKSICDHSWQGVAYGGVSQSYFLKKAMERIRKFVADSMAVFPSSVTDPQQWVGLARPDRLWEAGYGLQISEGTIPSVTPVYKNIGTQEEPEYELSRFGSEITVAQGATPTLGDVLESFGANRGDQITIVGILRNGQFSHSRYCVASEADDTKAWYPDVQEGIDSDILTDESKFGNVMLAFDATEKGMKVEPAFEGQQVEAAAVIISRKVGNVWQRSTEYLMPVRMVSSVDAIIKLWQLGTTEIPTENPYYLNNADV